MSIPHPKWPVRQYRRQTMRVPLEWEKWITRRVSPCQQKKIVWVSEWTEYEMKEARDERWKSWNMKEMKDEREKRCKRWNLKEMKDARDERCKREEERKQENLHHKVSNLNLFRRTGWGLRWTPFHLSLWMRGETFASKTGNTTDHSAILFCFEGRDEDDWAECRRRFLLSCYEWGEKTTNNKTTKQQNIKTSKEEYVSELGYLVRWLELVLISLPE